MKTLLNDLGIYTIGRVATAGVSIIFTMIVANWLSTDDYGRATNALAMCQFCVFLTLAGLNQGYVLLGKDRTLSEKQALLAAVHWSILGTSCVACAVLMLAWGSLSARFLGGASYASYFLPCALFVFVGGFTEINSVRLRFAFRARLFVVSNFLVSIAYVVFAVILLKLGAAGSALPWASALAGGIVAVGLWVMLGNPFRGKWMRVPWKDLLLVSLPLCVSALMATLPAMISRGIIASNIGMEQAGIYSLAFTLIQPVAMAGYAFTSAWAPHMLAHYEQPDFLRRASQLVTVLAFLVVLMAVTLPPLYAIFIPLLIKRPQLMPASYLCGPLLLAMGLRVIGMVLASGYIYRHRTYHAIWINGLACLISGLSGYLLAIPLNWGLLGVVLGEALGAGIGLVVGERISHRYIKIPVSRVYLGIWLAIGLLLVVIQTGVHDMAAIDASSVVLKKDVLGFMSWLCKSF